jgi:hypothetical protein
MVSAGYPDQLGCCQTSRWRDLRVRSFVGLSPVLETPSRSSRTPSLLLVPGGLFCLKGTGNGEQILTLNIHGKKVKLTKLLVQAVSIHRTNCHFLGFNFENLLQSDGRSLILLICNTTQPHEEWEASLIDWYPGPALADISWSKNHPVLGRQGVSGSLQQTPACSVTRGFSYTCHGHLTAHRQMWYL